MTGNLIQREKTQHSALSTQHFFLLFISLAYLAVAALFAVYTPPWQASDEPAHYNNIRQVAERGCCPVIEIGDWNLAYQAELTSRRFGPELLGELDTLQYEDHQPPLYYLLASVVFKLANGSLIALRLFSAFIGLGVVLSAYGVGRAMYPERPWIALGAAAFVAFLPQHVAVLAAVNNDALAEVVIGATLIATIVYLKNDTIGRIRPTPLLMGILVGIGFLTKASTLFLAGIVPLAILLKWWMGNRVGTRRAVSLRNLFAQLIAFAIPALLLGAIWWIRNVNVYGWPDFLGLAQHDRVVADQLRTADYIAQFGAQAYWTRAFTESFNSFWGQFGWMAVPMPQWVYRIIQGLLLVVVSGLLLELFAQRRKPGDKNSPLPEGLPENDSRKASSLRRYGWTILLTTLALAFAAFVYYNTEFVQHQGRYLFPGLIPFALLMALGVDGWGQVIEHRVGRGELAVRPYLTWLTAVIFLPFAVLDVYLLWRVIVPGLAP